MISKTIGFTLAAVWISALGSAGALAYTLNRPLVGHSTLRDAVGPSSATIARITLAPTPPLPEPLVFELAPVVVHARARAPSPSSPTKFRDLTDMHCSDWQPMTQGSTEQRVRSCE